MKQSFMSSRVDESMSMVSVADLEGKQDKQGHYGEVMTEDRIQQEQVLLSREFYKLGGGALGMRKQKRIVKIHKNGWFSYYKVKELKGFFRLGKSTICGRVHGQDY